MGNKVKVIKESDTGLNQKFVDTKTGKEMTRGKFVEEIKKGNYDDYHVRKVNGKNIPASNPDSKKQNNLG